MPWKYTDPRGPSLETKGENATEGRQVRGSTLFLSLLAHYTGEMAAFPFSVLSLKSVRLAHTDRIEKLGTDFKSPQLTQEPRVVLPQQGQEIQH